MERSPPDSAAVSVDLSHLEEDDSKIHDISLAQFYSRLQADPQTGLTIKEAATRLVKNGPNKLTPPRPNYIGKARP